MSASGPGKASVCTQCEMADALPLQDAEGSDGLKRPRTGLEGDDLVSPVLHGRQLSCTSLMPVANADISFVRAALGQCEPSRAIGQHHGICSLSVIRTAFACRFPQPQAQRASEQHVANYLKVPTVSGTASCRGGTKTVRSPSWRKARTRWPS